MKKASILWAVLIMVLLGAGSAHAVRTDAPRTDPVRKDAVIGLQLEPPHLDPTSAAAGAIDQVLYANVYQGLTRFNEDGAIAPQLAKSWEISQDGLEYTFTLQENVRFHDGTALDAKAVRFALNRARAENSTNAQKALFTDIESITIHDSLTLTIRLKQPNGQFLFNLAWGDAVIIAPHNVDDLRQKAIGTGPYQVAKWVKGDRIELTRHHDYWGKPPALESVIFRFISDAAAARAAVQAGAVDAFPAFPAPETLAQLAENPAFALINGTTEGETILAINHQRPPFDRLEIRQALAMAINRQDIIDGAMFGYGTPIGTHFAPHHPAYLDLTNTPPYNPETARKILKEAGLDGLTLTISLPPPSYARRGGEIIAAQLRNIGITAQLIPLEWAAWLEHVFRNKDYDLTIISHTEPFDIGIYARENYYFGYDSPKFRAIMRNLKSASDPQTRTRLLHQAQRHIRDDQVNVFLFQLANAGIRNARLLGLWQHAPTQALDVTGIYWKN